MRSLLPTKVVPVRHPILTRTPAAAVGLVLAVLFIAAAGCKTTKATDGRPVEPPSSAAVEGGKSVTALPAPSAVESKAQPESTMAQTGQADGQKQKAPKTNKAKKKKKGQKLKKKNKGFTPPPLYAAEKLRVGEKLYYRIHWKEIVGAHAHLEISGKRTFSGKEVIELKANLKTVPTVDSIFKIRDEVISYWDPQTKLPLFTHKELNEGFYKKRYRALWEPAKNSVVFFRNHYKGNTKSLGEKTKKPSGRKRLSR